MSMRQRRAVVPRGIPAAVVLALSLAGCGTQVAGAPSGAGSGTASAAASASASASAVAPGVPAASLGFTRYPDSVEWPSVSDYVPPGEGLQRLLTDGSCVLGIGTFQNGYRSVPVNWASGPGCTRLTLSPTPGSGDPAAGGDGPPAATGGWNGGGVYGQAVVRWTDGSLIAVNGEVDRVYPNGRDRRLADLGLPVPANPNSESEDQGEVSTAIRVGNRLLIGGGEMLSEVYHPLLWTSDDVGATVHRVPLPMPSGRAADTGVGALAADGATVVAVAAGASNAYSNVPQGQLATWSSTDAGAHWTVHTVDGLPAGSTITGVVRLADGWLAYGSIVHYGDPDRPLVLTSTDGSSWKRSDGPAMGPGDLVAATVDAAGRAVLVGHQTIPATRADTSPSYCGAVWVGDGSAADWRRGALGCGAEPPAAVTTLSDGRVLIAGNRDLWLGRPKR
ncbi:hypothetical protein [Streptacidiphilus sp. P02-A3a]|uniref:hypothetical protein n=1 Tax=Streptacidiphilus sp. P02-A3a TaxID=2704468 RepID=UPI0015FAAE29|nr:hypothetical protein [Streptacidiphilus sp. P02-A3a]QMU66816.1 hypothetical protein GXP74_18365 [Streptacidiphilus sp. P02-A3a]